MDNFEKGLTMLTKNEKKRVRLVFASLNALLEKRQREGRPVADLYPRMYGIKEVLQAIGGAPLVNELAEKEAGRGA
jgi:hypothetical protein